MRPFNPFRPPMTEHTDVTVPREPESGPRNHGAAVCLILVALAVGAVAVTGCANADDRPTEAEWLPQWEQRQELIPDARAIVAGGRELCDQLDGQFRVLLPELLPSPVEVLDDLVGAWISHAVSIVFECSNDEATLVQQFETLDVLGEEIDGGLG